MFVAVTPEECRQAAGLGETAGFVVTMGNFDGVHLGHQALVRRAVEHARERGLPSLAVTFDPHPATILGRETPPALTDTAGKLERLEALGLDGVWLAPFTRELAGLAAADFCHEKLVKALGARELLVGYDFHMGSDRADAGKLALLGREWHLPVTVVEAVNRDGQPVSSTRVRAAVAEGRLDEASMLLGRPHAVRGEVVHGAGRGGPLLGFPTANVEVAGLVLPPPAVYATAVQLADGTRLPSVTSFGRNPTFGPADLTLETYILDFSVDIYGQPLEVFFLKMLRPEKKFSGPEELVAQLRADVTARREMPVQAAFTLTTP